MLTRVKTNLGIWYSFKFVLLVDLHIEGTHPGVFNAEKKTNRGRRKAGNRVNKDAQQ